MATKDPKFGGYIIDGVDMGASIVGDAMDVSEKGQVGIALVADTDDHVGSITFQQSNDASNWFTISGYSITVSSGSTVATFITVPVCSKYFRVIYTRSSGGADTKLYALAIGSRIPSVSLGDLTIAGVTPGSGWDASGIAKETGGNLAAAASVLGATTGAAITTDVDGTAHRYLRGLVKIFADIWDSTNHGLKIVQATASLLKAHAFLGGRQFITAPTVVSISGTTARSSALTAGRYRLRCTTDCYILQGGSTVDATTSCYLLRAGELSEPMVVTAAADAYVAAITPTGATGSLIIEPEQGQ